jgi:hypothetical protein
MTTHAKRAAQSSAGSNPGPPISATPMPTKAAAEVMSDEITSRVDSIPSATRA